MEALHLASNVLPRIVAASYRYQLFPTTRGWAEMMRIDDLPQYADAQGSDIQQFLSPRDQAKSMIEGTDTALRRPAETSRWFLETSNRILELAGQAEASIGDQRSNEFVSTLADLRILAGLARYHSQRLPAGVCYNLYQQTGDLLALDDAVEHERQAIAAWETVVRAAADVYRQDLACGVHRVGFSRHWEEEWQKLRNGLEELEAQQRKAQPRVKAEGLSIVHIPVPRHVPSPTVRLRATVGAGDDIAEVCVRYCYDQEPWHSRDMLPTGEWRYAVEVPLADDTKKVKYFIEATDNQGHVVTVPAGGADDAVVMTITKDDQPPQVDLRRVPAPRPGGDVKVTARVGDPSGVKSVRLCYRHLTQFEDYRTEEMRYDPQTGLWSATIPGTFVVPQWDLMYFVEALDIHGNGRMYPDMEVQMPYVIVKLDRTL
jgi:hypothetical protein